MEENPIYIETKSSCCVFLWKYLLHQECFCETHVLVVFMKSIFGYHSLQIFTRFLIHFSVGTKHQMNVFWRLRGYRVDVQETPKLTISCSYTWRSHGDLVLEEFCARRARDFSFLQILSSDFCKSVDEIYSLFDLGYRAVVDYPPPNRHIKLPLIGLAILPVLKTSSPITDYLWWSSMLFIYDSWSYKPRFSFRSSFSSFPFLY